MTSQEWGHHDGITEDSLLSLPASTENKGPELHVSQDKRSKNETYMQVRKQQLELDMEQQTGSK